jgi:hypothetical protein
MILNQQLKEGIWVNWLAKIQDYDLEINTPKDVKGQGI